jgi:membrane-associated phospholipid phosphatase
VIRGLALAAALALATPARADVAGPFVYDLRIDLPLGVAGGLAWVLTEAFKADLVPAGCRWCDRDGSRDTLNALDATARDVLRLRDTASADAASNAFALGLAPLFALGLDALAAGQDRHLRQLGVDALLILEAGVMAADLNQTFKFAAMRERPFVHVLPADAKSRTDNPADNNLSFYSGHTTLAFALAMAAGTVATMRRYRLAPLVWTMGLAVAMTSGYLRIAADRHYMSDVLVGSAVGAAVGVMVPALMHRARAPRLALAATPDRTGAIAAATWRW